MRAKRFLQPCQSLRCELCLLNLFQDRSKDTQIMGCFVYLAHRLLYTRAKLIGKSQIQQAHRERRNAPVPQKPRSNADEPARCQQRQRNPQYPMRLKTCRRFTPRDQRFWMHSDANVLSGKGQSLAEIKIRGNLAKCLASLLDFFERSAIQQPRGNRALTRASACRAKQFKETAFTKEIEIAGVGMR